MDNRKHDIFYPGVMNTLQESCYSDMNCVELNRLTVCDYQSGKYACRFIRDAIVL